MKRARAEQLQTAALSYLKRKNYTDSEATFRSCFRFENSSVEAGSREFIRSSYSSLDAVIMTTESLGDYFLAFKAFQDFADKVVKNEQYKGLGKILFPLFLHSYLDLVIAGRQEEAEEFFYLYNDADLVQEHKEVLAELQNLKDSNDLENYFTIAQIRNNFCEVALTFDEKQLLLRFVHGQDNLLIMKIINERLRLDDVDQSCFELSQDNDNLSIMSSKNESTQQKSLVAGHTPECSESEESSMLISPPTVSTASAGSSSSVPQTAEKSPHKLSIDSMTISNCIQNVSNSQRTVYDVCLYKFNDSEKSITHAAMCHNQRLICCAKEDSTISLWNVCHDPQKGSTKTLIKAFDDESFTETSFPDISRISFGNEFKEDVLLRAQNASIERMKQLNEEKVVCLQGHRGPVYSSCFTHDDKYLLTCSEDTTIRLWDLKDLKNKVIYHGHSHPVWCIDMSALSMYFATGSMDCSARLWSIDRTFPLRIYAGHEQSVETLSFHGNASYLATADHTVRLWDVNSGKTVRLMTGHWAPVTSVAFSPDGKTLASAGEDSRIRIYDIASGSLFKEIRCHADTIYSLSFSSDSSMLASCGADSSIYVWNVCNSLPVLSSDVVANASSHPHSVAHWSLSKSVNKIISTKFSKDLLNSIAIV